MKITWRGAHEEEFDREDNPYLVVEKRPAAFLANCAKCSWGEVYDKIPGTKMHAAQFAEMVDIFERYSK